MKWFKRKFYGRLNFEDFMLLQDSMFWIGFDLSAYPPDYGKATCLNCRGIVNVGYDEVTLEYGKQHREVCGDRNLMSLYQDRMVRNLSDIDQGVMALPVVVEQHAERQ